MHNPTDLNLPDTGPTVEDVLAGVAAHFTATRPTDLLEPRSLLICVGAEAYKLTDRRSDGEAQALAKAAVAVAPDPYAGMTRGEYALLLRAALSYTWSDADSEPVIPNVTAGFPVPRPVTPVEFLPGPDASGSGVAC